MSSGRWFSWLVLLSLILALAAGYSNSFGTAFVFDDQYVVVTNPAIRDLRDLPRLFYDPFTMSAWRNNGDLRPIVQTTFALNYAVSGLNPWSYRAFSLLVHLLAAWLVFRIVRDHLVWPASERGPGGRGQWVGLAAALLFAIAPLNHQPVVYASARSALLATTFVLGAFLACLHRRYAVMTLLYLLALLSKAIAVTLPLTVLIYDFLYRDRARLPTLGAWLKDWRRLAMPTTLLVAATAAYLIYRSLLLPDWLAGMRHEAHVSSLDWLLSQWPALLYYVGQFFWPNGLSIDHDFPYATGLGDPRVWVSLLGILAWLGLAFRFRDRCPPAAFATLWYFVTLAPESTVAPLAEVVNDHRPYIASSLGLAVLAALGLEQLAVLARSQGRVFVPMLAGVVLAAVPVLRHRSWLWQDPARLWASAAEAGPKNGRAHMNAGQAFLARGELAEAATYLETAVMLVPGYPFAHLNMSALRHAQGRVEEALGFAETAALLAPNEPQFLLHHAALLEAVGRFGEAAQAFIRVLELAPGDATATAGLARTAAGSEDSRDMGAAVHLLHKAGRPADAVPFLKSILSRNPTHYGATYQLATALTRLGQHAEAATTWATMASLAREAHAEAVEREAVAQQAAAQRALAEQGMAAGVAALYQRKDAQAAVAHFRSVLALDKTHYGANYQLARALDAAGEVAEARAAWQTVRAAAETIGDKSTLQTATERLEALK